MPLSADESYYWVWSHALAPGYLDHPPMVALWIRLGTLLAGQTPFGIRLLGPLSALAGSLLLARAAEDLAPGRHAGPIAAALLNATLLLNVGSVVMTPDTPLLFFWTATLAALARLVRTGHGGWWLAVGLASGLALDSKYTAILLAPALLLWLVLVPTARQGLRSWQLWSGATLAGLLFAPVVVWNAAHGWASFAKQGGRTGEWHPYDAVRFLSELAASQVGLATPLLFCVFVAGLAAAARRAWHRDPTALLLAAVTLLPALVFVQHALGDRVQANWPAIVYPGAALASTLYARRFWQPAAALGFVIAMAVFLQAAFAPLKLPRALDFTLIRLAGWSDLAGAVYVERLQHHADFVAADEYGLASELAFRLRGDVVSQEARWHRFALPQVSLAGRSGILVRSLRQYGDPDPKLWADAELLATVQRGRRGVIAETYRIFRVTSLASRAVLLPTASNPAPN